LPAEIICSFIANVNEVPQCLLYYFTKLIMNFQFRFFIEMEPKT
jgi:hypothetical protein